MSNYKEHKSSDAQSDKKDDLLILKKFKVILEGLIKNRKNSGNDFSYFEAWSELYDKLNGCMTKLKSGKNLTSKQQTLISKLNYLIIKHDADIAIEIKNKGSQSIIEKSTNLADLKTTPDNVRLNQELNTLSTVFWSSKKLPEKNITSIVGTSLKDKNSEDYANGIKYGDVWSTFTNEWEKYREQERLITQCDSLITRLGEPTRKLWKKNEQGERTSLGLTHIFLSVTSFLLLVLFAVGAVLTVGGPWSTVFSLPIVAFLALFTLVTNIGLADQLLMSMAKTKIAFKALSGKVTSKWEKKERLKALAILGMIILAIAAIMCIALTIGFLVYGGMLFLFPAGIVGGILILTISMIITTALILIFLITPDFLSGLSKFLEGKGETANANKKNQGGKLIYISGILFLFGSVMTHVAAYGALVPVFGTPVSIIICVASFFAGAFFIVTSGLEMLRRLNKNWPFSFLRGYIYLLWKYFSAKAKKTSSLMRSLGYRFNQIVIPLFVIVIGMPLYFMMSFLTFTLQPALNHNELLDHWLMREANYIGGKIKEITSNNNWLIIKIPRVLLFLITSIAEYALYLCLAILTKLILGKPYYLRELKTEILSFFKSIHEKYCENKSLRKQVCFIAAKVFKGLLYIIGLPFIVAINSLCIVLGALMYILSCWRKTANALNNGAPALFAIIGGGGAVHVGKLILGIPSFIAASLNSGSAMIKNTLFDKIEPPYYHPKKTMDEFFSGNRKQKTNLRLYKKECRDDNENNNNNNVVEKNSSMSGNKKN